MFIVPRLPEGRFSFLVRKQRTTATLSLALLAPLSGLAQGPARKPVTPEAKKEPEIKEELTLKNGDRLTGRLLNSTGTEIKFKSDLAGEVTVAWNNVTELKSNREFAVIPKDVKNTRDSAAVPQGAIKIREKDIVVSPTAPAKSEANAAPSMTEEKASHPYDALTILSDRPAPRELVDQARSEAAGIGAPATAATERPAAGGPIILVGPRAP